MDERTLRFLVIDDNPADAEVLKRTLGKTPYRHVLVHHPGPDEGLAELSSQPYDCVFLDYILGGTNGLDVLGRIRLAGHDLTVIVLTGQGNESVAVSILQAGAQDYLTKGNMTPSALTRSVRNSMEKVAMTQRLAEKMAELQQFVEVASHDLRAPLWRIKGITEVLEERLHGKVDAEVDSMLRFVVSNAERMTALIDSLLLYTRVGRVGVPLGPVDLNSVANSALESLFGPIEESGAQVRLEPLPAVKGEAVALTQLLQNLIANGIKYRPPGTKPEVLVRAEPHDGEWRISVIDNGLGIDPRYQQEIFQPFRRLHSSKTFAGSGIGLAICARIAAQHGGRLWVESEPGRGSAFHFTLKRSEDPSAAPS